MMRGTFFGSQKNHSSFLGALQRDALQLYAEYFKYKVYFCKGDNRDERFYIHTR